MTRGSQRRGHEPDGGEQRRALGQGPLTVRSPLRETKVALAASRFWTTTAMQGAKPYPLPTVSAEDVQAMTLRGPTGGTRPAIVRGSPPKGAGRDRVRPVPTATQGGYDYPPPYTRYQLPELLYGIYPWITCGKVFFKQYDTPYVGSASSVGNSAIWTAGHIVHAGDNREEGWSTDMIFVPAYSNGQAPFGRWSVSFMRTTTAWYQEGNPGGLWGDIAGAVLYPLDGQTISERVGALGFAWNLGRFVHWHALGYPASSPFDGETMHDTQASYAYDGSVPGDVPPVAIGCDMTGGCSGGPWIYKLLDENALNGNNSYRISDRPDEMNSPYFDDRARTLYDELLAGTP